MSQYLSYMRINPDELYHHGIKGQHWGIRRYQNDDGSLTIAGKKRYGSWDEKKSTWKQKQRMLKDASKGNKMAIEARERYIADSNKTKSLKRQNIFESKAQKAHNEAQANADVAYKTHKFLQANENNKLEKSKGFILATRKADGSLTDHGKKSLQRKEIKAEKLKNKVDRYEQEKMLAMQKGSSARSNKKADVEFTKAGAAQRNEVRYMEKGLKVIKRMESKYGSSYMDDRYRAQGQEYMSKLNDIYNQRIIYGRK